MTSSCDKQVSSEDAQKSFGSKADPCSFDSTVSSAVYNTMTGNIGVNFGIMSMLNVFPWMAVANLSKKALQVATEKLGKLSSSAKVGTLTAMNDPKEALNTAVIAPVSSAVNATGNAISAVGTKINEAGVSAVEGVQQVGEKISTSVNNIAEGAQQVGESVSKTTSAFGQSMKDRFNKLRGKTGGGDEFTEEECSFF